MPDEYSKTAVRAIGMKPPQQTARRRPDRRSMRSIA
jgi:hypothetical protein